MGLRINQLTWTLREFYESWVLYWFRPKWEKLLLKALSFKNDDFDRSVEMGTQAVELAIARRGPDHPDVVEALMMFAGLYDFGPKERNAEGETHLLRALEIQEKAFGPDDPKLVEVLSRLATRCYFHDQPEKADAYLGRAVTIREKALGPDHPDVAELLDLQARYLRGQREDYAAAEPLFRRALEIYEKSHGPNHRRVWASLGSLAETLKKLGRYEEAESLYLRSLESAEHFTKPDLSDVASSLCDLAGFYSEQGRHAEAEAYCRRAMAVGKNTDLLTQFHTFQIMKELAESLDKQDRTVEADRLYDEIPEIKEQNCHTNGTGLLGTVALNFAFDEKHQERSERLLKRLLALREKSLGPKHPGLAPVLEQLGDLYGRERRYDEAEAHCMRALAILEKTRGSNHPDTADCLRHLAGVYQSQRQYDRAEPLLLRILEIRKRVVAADRDQKPPFLKRLTRRRTDDSLAEEYLTMRPVDVVRALEDLAHNHHMQKDFAGAEQYFRQVLEIKELWTDEGCKRYGTARTLNKIADLYIEQKQYAQADALLERADSSGQHGFDVFIECHHRAKLYEDQGEYDRALEVYQNTLQAMEQNEPLPGMTATLLKDMARFYRVAGRESDAEACEQRAAKLEPAQS
jgi:tetratricopeptide (TPR) repeat protein